LLHVVDLRRHPLAPLLAAHVAGEFIAEFVGPGLGGGPQAQGVVVTTGDNATAVGAESDARHKPLCPRSGAPIGWRPAVPQAQDIVETTGDDATAIGLKATLITGLLCPRSGFPIGWQSCIPQAQGFVVTTETMRLPSGLKATLVTMLLCRAAARRSAGRSRHPTGAGLVRYYRRRCDCRRAEGDARHKATVPRSGAPMGWPLPASTGAGYGRYYRDDATAIGLKATLVQGYCPAQRRADGWPLPASHRRRVWSLLRRRCDCHRG